MYPLSLLIITKGEASLQKALASALPIVSEVVIVDTRSDRGTPLDIDTQGKPLRIVPFTWCDDFAAARNAGQAAITCPFYLWLDSDDVLEGAEQLRDYLVALPDVPAQVTLQYDYEHTPEGSVITAQIRERVIPTGAGKWHCPVHEVWLPETQIPIYQGPTTARIKHSLVVNDPGAAVKRRRNIAIMEKHLAENAEPDRRLVLHYIIALIAEARLDDALVLLRKFIEREPEGWCRTRSYRLMADCYNRKEDWTRVAQLATLVLSETPQDLWAYRTLFNVSMVKQRWMEALYWFRLAYQDTKREVDILYWNPEIQQPPWEAAAIAALHLGAYDQAEKFASRGKNTQLMKDIQRAIRDERLARNSVELMDAAELEDGNRRTFARLLPACIRDLPAISRYLAPELPPNKLSVAIYCGAEGGGQRAGMWGPQSLKEGIGGSEEAVIRLAPLLAKQAHVECYGPWLKDEVIDGVHWRHFSSWVDRPFSVFVAWRHPAFTEIAPKAAKRVVWFHDAVEATEPHKMDEAWVLSEYHAKVIAKVYPDTPIWVTSNGIPNFSELKIEKVPGYVIYASSPDRGLVNLLDMWPTIREKAPKAELHIFYGFNQCWAHFEKQYPQYRYQREHIEECVRTLPGIVWHGNVGQDELHREFAKACVWAYPTEFNEISCITAMKAQALGAMPVCSSYAALAETVKYGVKLGQADTPDILTHRDAFIAGVVDFSHGRPREAMLKDARTAQSAFAWTRVAQKWIAQMETLCGKPSSSHRKSVRCGAGTGAH